MLKKLKNDIIKIQENFGGAEMQEHFKTETATMPLASMKTRQMVAEDTRKIIEQAFASGEPYANFEIFRNLFDVEEILDVRNEFVFKINIEKFGNPVAAGQLVRTYATEIHYFNFRGKSLTEKNARACEFESNSGNEDKIPIEIKEYFEKILDIFYQIMLDKNVEISSCYVMSLLINLADLAELQ